MTCWQLTDDERLGIAMKGKEIQITTIIGRGTECNGDFSADSSVRIDGVINGNVTVTGALTVGATGRVLGDVKAQSLIVGGEINGNVEAPERVEMTATARVIGDIRTSVIVIDEKAIFQGKCDMNQEVSAKKAKPAAKAVRASKKTAKAAIAEALKEVAAAEKKDEAKVEMLEKVSPSEETNEVQKQENAE